MEAIPYQDRLNIEQNIQKVNLDANKEKEQKWMHILRNMENIQNIIREEVKKFGI